MRDGHSDMQTLILMPMHSAIVGKDLSRSDPGFCVYQITGWKRQAAGDWRAGGH